MSVPKNTSVSEPIFIESSDAKLQISIIAEHKSKAAVSIFLTPTMQSSECEVAIHAHDHAELNIVFVQLATSNTVHIVQKSTVGKEAKLHVHNITLGGSSVDHVLTSEVQGERGVSTVDWLFYAKNKEKQNISATNVFNASTGGGEITLKGVAEDKAHVQCNGMINIGLDGGGTDAYLTEDVLMLDASAKVDAIPGLEIKTNDVKASHSATVSQVSPGDLFYFKARGIEEEYARKMFIEGFLGSTVERISSADAQERVVAAIAKKYADV